MERKTNERMRGGAKVSGGQADKRGSELDASYNRLLSDIPTLRTTSSTISTTCSTISTTRSTISNVLVLVVLLVMYQCQQYRLLSDIPPYIPTGAIRPSAPDTLTQPHINLSCNPVHHLLYESLQCSYITCSNINTINININTTNTTTLTQPHINLSCNPVHHLQSRGQSHCTKVVYSLQCT